jgi:hypothetical protein
MSSTREVSRRTMIRGAAVVPAIAILPTAAIADVAATNPVAEPDPIFAAIEKHRQLTIARDELSDNLTDFEDDAPRNDSRPIPLVAWRQYTHIGGSEIERAREEFLAKPRASHKRVEREYQKVQQAYRAKLQAMEDWDERHGIAPQRAEYRRLDREAQKAERELSTIKLTTAAGAGALVAYVRSDIIDIVDYGDWSWALAALANAANSLQDPAAVSS